VAGVIVLDASVLIAYGDAADGHHQAADELLVEAAYEELGASTITLAEVLVSPARAGKLDTARRMLEELEVVEIGLDRGAAARLATLRAQSGLKLPDCCVLLAAEQAAGQVATFDDHLGQAAASMGLAVRGRSN
jgi:predicted nucleic acid-binding protein